MNIWKKLFVGCLYLLIFWFHHAQCTEVTVSSSMIDKSLGLEIELPTLMCHAKHIGYKEVTWYKDYVILKKGSADLESHILSLKSLLNSSVPSVSFDHPFKLQGYYWCETELTVTSSIHDFLFRIKEIHTFVGKLVATKDSLGDSENLSEKDKIAWKMQIYEDELQTQLFGFLQPPSVFVTKIKVFKEGLAVHFFLYVRPAFQPRKPIDDKLLLDHHHFTYIQEFLRKESAAVDPEMYYIAGNWTDLLGINIRDTDLRSTLGCYEVAHQMSSHKSEEVSWPYARIGEIVIPDNACSSKDGLAVTRICTGSFYQGAKWGNPSGKCEKPAEGITLKLKNLYNEFGNEDKAHYIQRFAKVMKHSGGLDVTDLHIVVEILKELSVLPKLNQREIRGILSVIDVIVETNTTELIAAKNTIRLTNRVLQIFDNLLKVAAKEGKEIQLSVNHLMVDTKYTKTDDKNHILGLAVLSSSKQDSLKNGSIQFVTSNSKLPEHESIAYFALPLELILRRESMLGFPCQVNMIFFKEWYLFQNPKGALVMRNFKVLPTPVMYVSMSGGPAWNLTDPVHLYFKDMVDIEVEDPVCVYYDTRLEEGVGGWSTEGCEYKGLINGFHYCQCHHLSIFAILLSENPESIQKVGRTKLGASVYAACGVSILALSVAVLLFILSKNWRQTVDHSILFCICLTFLVCVVLIFISEMHFARRTGCIILALILHYTIFSIFFWLQALAIVYRLRFAKKTDISEVPHFMIKASLIVWGIPMFIVIIMWLSQEYPCAKDHCWLTVAAVAKQALIPVVALIIVVLCINVCATYSLTCRFKKDFLVGDSSYNDVALKFRVAFTIFFFFVLSWLFGFCALQERSQTLRILFSISITLTAYYVSLFFIFQEISFWDLCHRCKQGEKSDDPPENPPVQYKAKSYNTVEESENTVK